MTNIKVSVVVPVYNVEKYLEECLDSIVNQTLRETEIICVNDGSTDGSPEILQKYAAKDDRIIICTQENRGLSAARNNGAAQAHGKYLYFMDSDDILELSALEILYKKAEADNLDVLYFDADAFTNDPECEEQANHMQKYCSRNLDYKGIHKGSELLSKMVKYDDYIVVAWLQFINRNYYVLNKLGFYEGILYEDNPFTYECMMKAGRVGYLPSRLYRYRVRPNSITTRAKTFAAAYGRFICYLEMNRVYKEHNMADVGDEMLFKPVKLALSRSRSFYRDNLPPEERQKASALPDGLRQTFQTLVVDVCNKRDKRNARKQKIRALFARFVALKNSIFPGPDRQ